MIEIKNRWTGALIFTAVVAETLRAAVVEALGSGADLREADLREANLGGADLREADLREADLRGADLREADLREANLGEADLREADLGEADLREADLREADLREADLGGADLGGANLQPVRDDLWAVLCSAPKEVPGLRLALVEGRIEGSAYEGECACLVGTLANVRGCNHTAIPGLAPDSSRPAERWFLSINTGDTPETNEFSKLAVEWIDHWTQNMQEAFAEAAK